MGRANVLVTTELRDWLYAHEVWRAGIYILAQKAEASEAPAALPLAAPTIDAAPPRKERSKSAAE